MNTLPEHSNLARGQSEGAGQGISIRIVTRKLGVHTWYVLLDATSPLEHAPLLGSRNLAGTRLPGQMSLFVQPGEMHIGPEPDQLARILHM